MKFQYIVAETAKEASEKYAKMRDESGEGASTWPDGNWSGHRISYNGKIWDGETLIYDPYAETKSDDRTLDTDIQHLNPELKAKVGGLRGGIQGTAEQQEMPARYIAEPHPSAPLMVICDLESGATTEVPLYAYRDVRKALNDLAGSGKDE